ncbi:alkaline phosphatase family protein [Methanothermobacter sp. K4]|uniref:alkaline phosphatase family protein n=1 Tax=Methanothermobacter sp. K4 TaxID=2913262 RepID=UPI001EDBE14C|nr:alkaline phosphatase family protein [Methanothermobacter sp. K4]MCG2829232.1 alkaline phosphatase family protein [Methanothermobacter sp. K4]
MKVVVIGIDGLDRELLNKFEEFLPNFRILKENSPNIRLKSVFPPDSPTAWASIYTGKNPAQHGIISFRDPFNEIKYGSYIGNDISGRTFWDVAGRIGKRVCVLFPHMGYPVWEVNGIMIGRTTEVDIKDFDIQCWPEELVSNYDLKGLKPLTSYPVNIGDIIEPTKKVILNEMKVALQLFNDIDWDLYFYYSSSLDNIQHLFWMYCDKDDPYYEEGNSYENVILDFYMFYDRNVIGPLMDNLDDETALIVLSDHGHAMRPVKVVNINEILRRKGFLKLADEKDIKSNLINKIKKTILSVVDEHRSVGKLASLFLRLFPRAMRYYVNTTLIDGSLSLAYLSDPSGGIKSYSYAGIRINKEVIDSYDSLREELIDLLLSIKDPKGKKLVEWAARREDVYEGDHLEKYPEILFKLVDEWGVGWDVDEEIFSESSSHKLHSGNHRAETPVLFVYNTNLKSISEEMDLMDISPLILTILKEDTS